MMVVEEVAEALTADFEAQWVSPQKQPKPLAETRREDHPPAPAFEDRLAVSGRGEKRDFFIEMTSIALTRTR